MSTEERKVGPKGQVVVPEAYRKALGIRSGSMLRIRLDNGRLIIEKVEGDVVGQLERIAKSGPSIQRVKAHEYEEELKRRVSR